MPKSILVSVWGLESNFGRFAGVRPTVPVLATLAYDGRRAALFRGELLNALRILDRGDIELERLKGSWAGAMGQPQFLPSSYLKFAQDFDGDGRRDIWTSLPDVLASIANYMASNGWVHGESWGRRVKLPPDFDARLGAKAPLRSEGCRAVRQLTEPMLLKRVAGDRRPHGEGHAAAEGGDRGVPAARRPGDVPRLPQLRDAAHLQLRPLLRDRGGAAGRSPRRPARELAGREEGGQAGAARYIRFESSKVTVTLASLPDLTPSGAPAAIPWRLTGVPAAAGLRGCSCRCRRRPPRCRPRAAGP